MVHLWRPTNSSHGVLMESICAECENDAAFQKGEGDSCPIAARLYVERSAPEWVVENGCVTCTAFKKIVPAGLAPRCDKTMDMFDRK